MIRRPALKKPARLLATLALGGGLVFAMAVPAFAAEETIGSCMVEHIDKLGGAEKVETTLKAGEASGASAEAVEAKTKIEDDLEACLKAPNPIIPAQNEIIWGGLSFLILLGAMIKFGFPAVRRTMDARTERIRNDLQAAQAARQDAERLKAENEAELAKNRASAAALIDQARAEAADVKANLQQRAEADIAEMRQRGVAEVEAARQRALADLQSEVADIVVGAAGRVVDKNLDVATHRQLIDDYIANVARN